MYTGVCTAVCTCVYRGVYGCARMLRTCLQKGLLACVACVRACVRARCVVRTELPPAKRHVTHADTQRTLALVVIVGDVYRPTSAGFMNYSRAPSLAIRHRSAPLGTSRYHSAPIGTFRRSRVFTDNWMPPLRRPTARGKVYPGLVVSGRPLPRGLQAGTRVARDTIVIDDDADLTLGST